MMTLLAQGAEAKLFLENDEIRKYRFAKSYRQPELDFELRKARTRREAKLLTVMAKEGILAPALIEADDSRMEIKMSFLDGPLLKEQWDVHSMEYVPSLAKMLAKMHAANVIHGDLTTSNMVATKEGIGIIDFGLSFFSAKIEDKAVDLHVLKQALTSKHYKVAEKSFAMFAKVYVNSYAEGKQVLDRLIEVEQRGRYKMKQWIDGS